MIFTKKSPKSRRFYQLGFSGFTPKGRNSIEKYVNTWAAFLRSLFVFFGKKVVGFFVLTGNIVITGLNLPKKAKEFLIVKLIWSRGRLGRPIALIIVLAVSFTVFTFAEILSSSRLVISEKASADYLKSTSDIIPKKFVATTKVPDIRKRNTSFKYEIQSGDTLSGIGEKYKISVDALKYVNGLTDTSILAVGDELTIPPVSGLIHTVEEGDTLTSIAEKYDVAPQAIADFNYILDTSTLALGSELVVPDAKIPEPIAPPVYAPPVYLEPSTGTEAPEPSKNYCVWPTTVRIISQYFTWYHNGIDIATPWNRGMPPIFSCTGGRVVRAGWDPYGLGLHVKIDHGGGYTTTYGHLSRIDVDYGQKISRGQQIGVMGSTGRSTGPHVHFIVDYNGVSQNPFNYVN